MYRITNQLALGGLTSIPASERATAILNLFEEQPYEPPAYVVYRHNGFPDEHPFPIETIWESVRWIDRHVADGHRVLVHCAEGNSRSVSVVIAYLIFTGCSLEAANSLILSKKRFYTVRGVETSNPLQFRLVLYPVERIPNAASGLGVLIGLVFRNRPTVDICVVR